MEEEKQVIGIAWFQPEQWDRLVEISEDRDALDDSYEDWRENANGVIHQIRKSGNLVKKVKLDLEELILWCNEKGISVNGEARAEFISIQVRQLENQP